MENTNDKKVILPDDQSNNFQHIEINDGDEVQNY